MFKTLKNAWGLVDLRKKILFVLFILLVYRIGTVIPVPFVNADRFAETFGNTIFSYMDILSGGSLSQATLFALGISPYITASIVMQLLAVAIPALERMSSSEDGKKKINNITRFVTIALAILTAIGYYALLSANGMLDAVATRSSGSKLWILYAACIVVCFCAGAALVMWLAENINENGLGNGISLILFANIISRLPSICIRMYEVIHTAAISNTSPGKKLAVAIPFVVLTIAFMVGMTVFIVFITGSERRIPVQYAKRVVGRKMYGGQSQNLPIQLNMSGVMPVIFASSILSIVPTILTLIGKNASSTGFAGALYRFFNTDGWFYPVMLFILIIAFAYFYITISFNPIEVANNLKKNGGTIPGIRQGRPTSEYIQRILSRVTLMGALFLSIIAILPIIANPLVVSPVIRYVYSDAIAGMSESYINNFVSYMSSSFTFGGTSILIVVGVALETTRELESQMTMRNYKGFLD